MAVLDDLTGSVCFDALTSRPPLYESYTYDMHVYIYIYITLSLSHMLSLAHLLPLLHPCAIYIDLLVQEPKRSKVPSHMPAFKANLFPLLRPCAIRFPESKAQESMLSVAHLLPLLSPCAV